MTARRWQGGYRFRPFDIQTTGREFTWSRRSLQAGQVLVPSTVSTVYTPDFEQNICNGVIQGRRQSDVKGASAISRRIMWRFARQLVHSLSLEDLMQTIDLSLYAEIKDAQVLQARKDVKRDVTEFVLRGWLKNDGDNQFTLFSCNDTPL
jgi:tRNA-specific adenosine deaminase 1